MEKRGTSWTKLMLFSQGQISDQSGDPNAVKELDIRGKGVWVDWALACRMATWINKRFEVEVMDLVTRYMTNVITASEMNMVQSLLRKHATTPDSHQEAESTESPPTTSNSETARPSVRARRACLAPIPGLPPMHVPMSIAGKPGGYAGVLGMEDGYVDIKVGESAVTTFGRWNDAGGHISTSSHARLCWAATPKTPLVTGKHIQDKLKQVMRSQWCINKGVRPKSGTQGEEYLCPLEMYIEVLDHITHAVEDEMGEDIIGSRKASIPTEMRSDIDLEIAREHTKWVKEVEQTKREIEKEKSKQMQMQCIMHLSDKSFTYEQIHSLQPR